MLGTLWDSISHVWYVALLAVAVAALHTKANSMLYKLRSATATLNAKRERNSYITLNIRSKPSGLETQPPPAIYAAYPSNQAMPSKQIMSKQETQTVNYLQHTDGVTPVGVVPPSPSHNHQPNSRQTTNQTFKLFEHIL